MTYLGLADIDAAYHSATEPSSWNTRAIGRVPPNGYLQGCFGQFEAEAWFSESGNRPSTMRMPGSRTILPRFCRRAGSTPPQISCTRKFGIAESTCIVASPPIGPFASMRRHGDAGDIGQARDLPQSRDAAHMVDIRLQNIDDAHLNQLAATVGGDQPLAGGNRRSGALRDLVPWPARSPAGRALR